MEILFNKYQELKEKGTLKRIVKTVSFLLPLVLLIVSFYALNGWKFWVSQAVGWLGILNVLVFRKMFNMLKKMPEVK